MTDSKTALISLGMVLASTAALSAQLSAPVLPQNRADPQPTLAPLVVPDLPVLPMNPSRQEPLPAPAEPNAPSLLTDPPIQGISTTEEHCSLTFSQQLLELFIATHNVEDGPVRDFILGADVFGSQRTSSKSSIELIPAPASALMLIHLSGTTQHKTTSYTPQSAINSCGNYQFRLTKQIQFDGRQFSTWSPAAFLSANLQNVAAETPLTLVPVLGPLANLTALNIANLRNPETQQIAVHRVTQQLAPRFNESVDAEISALNQFLAKFSTEWLPAYELQPLVFTAQSNAQQVIVSAALNPHQQQLEPTYTPLDPGSHGALVVSDSFLNSLAQKLPLAGIKIADTQLENLMLENLLRNKSMTLTASTTPKFYSLIMDRERPLQVFLRNDGLEVELRLSIQPVLGPAHPSKVIVIRFTSEIQGETLQLIPTVVSVRSLSGDPLSESTKTESSLINGSQGEIADLSSELIKQQIQNELTPQILPRTFSLPPVQGNKAVHLNILRVTESRGKLKIDFNIQMGDPHG